MPSEWPLVPLGEVSLNFDTRRKPVKEAERVAGPYPYYGASGIVDFVDGYLFDGEYLLIAEDGENLRTRNTPIAFRARGKFWVNNHAHIIQGNGKASTRYLEYAVLSADIGPYLTGAVMPKLTQGNLNKILVPCPSIEIQNQVVDVLGALDDKIALLRATNATLEAIAQALFKSWFVDFDPVRAKRDGRDPEGVPPEVADLFPSEFEDSALGSIPKGWWVKPFADTVEVLGGGTPKTSVPEYWGGDIPWFSVVDAPAPGQVFTVATEKSVTELGIQHSSARVLPAWTTVISARGTVGKLALTGVEMAMNQSCYGLRSKTKGGEVLTYLAAQRLVDTLKRLAHGGVFDTITRATLASVNVCEIPGPLVTAFGATVIDQKH